MRLKIGDNADLDVFAETYVQLFGDKIAPQSQKQLCLALYREYAKIAQTVTQGPYKSLAEARNKAYSCEAHIPPWENKPSSAFGAQKHLLVVWNAMIPFQMAKVTAAWSTKTLGQNVSAAALVVSKRGKTTSPLHMGLRSTFAVQEKWLTSRAFGCASFAATTRTLPRRLRPLHKAVLHKTQSWTAPWNSQQRE